MLKRLPMLGDMEEKDVSKILVITRGEKRSGDESGNATFQKTHRVASESITRKVFVVFVIITPEDKSVVFQGIINLGKYVKVFTTNTKNFIQL